MIYIAEQWKDYEILDMHNGEKLERFGDVVVIRPDPQIVWPSERFNDAAWKHCHMHYYRSRSGGGHWERHKPVPDRWVIAYRDMRFYIKPTDFKHMGLFPEQAANWLWIADMIGNAKRPVKVLNLFGYTGGATVAAGMALQRQQGGSVTHVDAAKAMNAQAKDNATLNRIEERHLRFITDDVLKFVQREKRRSSYYDAIIMDPPSYGRGPSGEVWKIEDQLYDLVSSCVDILSDQPLFFLINSYTTGFSPTVLMNIINLTIDKRYGAKKTANIYAGELGLPCKNSLVLPCGIFGRAEF